MSSRPTDDDRTQRTLRLGLEYDGRRFDGWHGTGQVRTVAGDLGASLERVLRERPAIHAAVPTDPGVHAEGQVASLRTSSSEPARKIEAALERVLPGDLAVFDVADAAPGFHARQALVSVSWTYRIALRRSPLRRGRSWLVLEAIDRRRLETATRLLVGKLDLAGFADRKLVKLGKTRTKVLRAVWREEDPLLVFDVEAEELSCRTVRRLVGSLIAVGRGELTLEAFEHRLMEGVAPSKGASHLAPSPGLVLRQVELAPGSLEAPLEGGPMATTAKRAVGALESGGGPTSPRSSDAS